MKNVCALTLLLLLLSCGREEHLSFERVTYGNENCVQCPDIRIELPKVMDRRKIGKTVNNALKEEVISLLSFDEEYQATSIEDAMASFGRGYEEVKLMFPDENMAWEATVKGDISFENKDILSIALDSYIYTGGAHGYGSTRFLNFNKKTGEELERDELIKNLQPFEEYAEEQFRRQQNIPMSQPINSTGFMFEQDEFYLSENIGFTIDGLKLLYNPYEVASYADGSIEVILPYEESEKFLSIKLAD